MLIVDFILQIESISNNRYEKFKSRKKTKQNKKTDFVENMGKQMG